jgi:hypothetical protein
MPRNDDVSYKDYVIYPMAMFVDDEKKWQPLAVITRETNEGMTLPRSQSFPQLPVRFDSEDSALDYALQFGQWLIDGKQQGLTI